jgi:alpha-mannosidase
MFKMSDKIMLRYWIVPVLISTTISFSYPGIQQAGKQKYQITVNVLQKDSEESKESIGNELFTNGFREVISGNVLSYHSSHPNAESALIARARKDMQSISWRTDTLMSTSSDSYHRFLWLSGLERAGWEPGGTPRTFELFINGEKWFTFKNLKDSSALNWTVYGKAGATLSFHSDMVDRYGDVFGRMIMQLPKKHFPANAPLIIRVDGENSESGVWFMMFTYPFSFTPTLRAEPAILRTELREVRLVRLSLDNLCGKCSVEISGPLQESIRRNLDVGVNNYFLPIDAVLEKIQLELIYQRNGKTVQQQTLEIRPVIERDIYILPYSHNDIGYTDLQKNIERKQWRNLEQALDLIGRTRAYPENARFKWNLEVTWPLESYFAQALDDKRRAIVEEYRNGNICVNALFANMLTGLVSDVEMKHLTDFARAFSRTHSSPITTAVVSDIPGFTWGIVTVLAQSGVKYFSIAPNAGDRVGNIYEALGDKPFYWVSQSGEEKVLTWLAAASYSTFHEGELSRLGEEKMLKLVRKLDEQNYPYRIAQLPYTIGGDNGPPDSTLPAFVMEWNKKYRTPRLRIATHAEMFRDFEREYGKTLPTLKGDFTPYWEDGAASSAYETALNRAASNRLVQGEILWSMNSPEYFPEKEYLKAWHNVMLYNEHTWGAYNSVSDPDSPFVINQWNVKRQFALDADSLSQALLAQAVGLPVQSHDSPVAIDVYNTNSRHRSDVVILSGKQSTIGEQVTGENGGKILSQRLSTGELAFYAQDIPPVSAKRYYLTKGNPFKGGNAKASGNKLENDLVSITVSLSTGAIDGIIWKGKELVDRGKDLGINRYLYVPGKDPVLARSLSNVKISVKEQGGLMASLLIEADAPGCKSYTSEIRVYDGMDGIDIINTIVKNAVREKEGVHFAFPFNVRGGEVRYDVAYGIVKPEEDQLPGSCKNFFSVQSFIDASGSDYGVTLIPVDAPLVEMGAINAEQPWMKNIEASQCFYSYVMNNYWHTNYKADQEGKVSFRYSICPHEGSFTSEVVQRAHEVLRPLIAAECKSSSPNKKSLLLIEPDDLIVSNVKPIVEGNAWIVQLYNPSALRQKVRIKWNNPDHIITSMSNIFEEKIEALKDVIELPPFVTRFIRADQKTKY